MVGIRVNTRAAKTVSLRPGQAAGNLSGKIRLANMNFDFAYFVKPDPKNKKGYLYGLRPVAKNGGRLTSDIARVEFMLHPSYSKPHQLPRGPRFELATYSLLKNAVPVAARVHLKSKPGEVQVVNVTFHATQAPQLNGLTKSVP